MSGSSSAISTDLRPRIFLTSLGRSKAIGSYPDFAVVGSDSRVAVGSGNPSSGAVSASKGAAGVGRLVLLGGHMAGWAA